MQGRTRTHFYVIDGIDEIFDNFQLISIPEFNSQSNTRTSLSSRTIDKARRLRSIGYGEKKALLMTISRLFGDDGISPV